MSGPAGPKNYHVGDNFELQAGTAAAPLPARAPSERRRRPIFPRPIMSRTAPSANPFSPAFVPGDPGAFAPGSANPFSLPPFRERAPSLPLSANPFSLPAFRPVPQAPQAALPSQVFRPVPQAP